MKMIPTGALTFLVFHSRELFPLFVLQLFVILKLLPGAANCLLYLTSLLA